MNSTSLRDIARWCGTEYSGDEFVTGGAIDSREVQKDDLFFALPGEKADGHDYIQKACEKGAAAAVVTRPVEAAIPTILVKDGQKAMAKIAAEYRKTLQAKITAITGSVGKTTTKEMTWAVLSKKYKTGKTVGNHNNELGLPLTMFSLDSSHKAAVLELGMNHFGELSRLTAIAKPDVAAIANIGTMHIEFLGSREGILKAKLEILEGLAPDGLAILNGDEPLLINAQKGISQRICLFGIENKECQVLAENIKPTDTGIEFDAIVYGERVHVSLPVEGRHNVMNALAAMAVGHEYFVPLTDMAAALGAFQNTGMRQNTYIFGGYNIIEDCYNAGPESTAAALSVLAEKDGRRIAVLGSMLELGSHSRIQHEIIGRLAAISADVLLTYGEDMVPAAKAAREEGMEAYSFLSHEELVEKLKSIAKPEDTVLFKGSRGMAMEQALKAFLNEVK